MNEEQFWQIIEASWRKADADSQNLRNALGNEQLPADKARQIINAVQNSVVFCYEEELDKLSKEELLAFDRILEQKLYALDTKDIYDYSCAPKERFLFARGFVVLAGKIYFEKVCANPKAIVSGFENEEICSSTRVFYFHKFDEEMPKSEISRETGSNTKAWA